MDPEATVHPKMKIKQSKSQLKSHHPNTKVGNTNRQEHDDGTKNREALEKKAKDPKGC